MRIPRSSCLAALTLAVLLLPSRGLAQSMCNAVSNNPLVMQMLCSEPLKARAVPVASISVTITVDLQQKDKDQTDFEQGIRKTAAPSEENTMTEEVVHADIIDHDPVGQVGKSPDQKEAEAKPGIDEISKQKKGDAGKAKERVNEILHPDKKKPDPATCM